MTDKLFGSLSLLIFLVFSEICLLCKPAQDPEPGSCEASKKQWYFEPKSGQCKQFIYGGCEGNQNNFKTKALCEKDCIGNKVKNFRSAPEPLTDSEICELPPDSGDCFGYHRNWFFDLKNDECRQFIYGGCAGNENNFYSKEQCEEKCVHNLREEGFGYSPHTMRRHSQMVYNFLGVTTAECFLPADPGTCNALKEKWYYDWTKKECKTFNYGGCDGNPNRFNTEDECLEQCQPQKHN